eukprot:TRINITY_DN42849_c0_g1_i1.p1 TRINITY_DN42849_c0_g1~~TRINITY_DN42849_c0_g1_i1.p1  ORF type:complete len:268 (+),score=61.85 TRINITY_DN42849_c0_g1_i1:98-805(+)
MDVLKDFRDGRSSVWKQFVTDVHRQTLVVDGENMRGKDIAEIVSKMTSITSRVLCKRKTPQKNKAPSVVSYISSYLQRRASPQPPSPPSSPPIAFIAEDDEVLVSSPLPDISPAGVPALTPENSSIMRHVDTLAIFCQQGVLGLVFEVLNKQYSQFNYNVYVDNGTAQGTPTVSISEGLSEGGQPEVLITIKKLFRLFQIDNSQVSGAADIGHVNVELELGLFSRQKVQLKLQGS